MIRISDPKRVTAYRQPTRTFWLVLAAAVLSLYLGDLAAEPDEVGTKSDPLGHWLTTLSISSSVVNAFAARRHVDARSRQWIVQHGQSVYVLAAQPALARSSLVQQAQRRAVETRARHGLLLYAAGHVYQEQGFRNREAIAKALAQLEGHVDGHLLSGLQSRSAVLETQVVALVWIEETRIVAYRQQPPAMEQFLPAYCQALYPTAKALFQEQRFSDALALYQEMYARQCQRPIAYFLDAADCFLALEQPSDARRMAQYVLNRKSPTMDSETAERLGDILFSASDMQGADDAYDLAWRLLQQGR